MSSGRGHCRAFTLIEAILVFALAVLVLGIVLELFVSAFRVTHKAQTVAAHENRMRMTIDRILEEFQESVAYLDVPLGNLAALDSGSSVVRFVKYDEKYPPGQQTRWVQFSLEPDATVVRKEGEAVESPPHSGSWNATGPETAQVIAQDVQELTFKRRPLGADQSADTQLIDLTLRLKPE